MEILVKAAQLLLSLSILVILHEFGHFAFAKLFNTRVEKFYLFFDPWFSLFKFKKGDTEYGIGWVPLGGYVKISGMIDESMDKEQMKLPPQPWEFRSKPSWQRLLIMVGGVMVNFLLALFIYSMVLYAWGEEYIPTANVKYGIACDSLALKTGLQNGDKILSVDHKKIEDFNRIVPEIVINNAQTIQVERNGSEVNVNISKEILPILIKDKNAGFFTPRFPFVIAELEKQSVAQKSGMQPKDKIVKINDKKIDYFDEFRTEVVKFKEKPVTVGLLRGKDTVTVSVVVPATGILGIRPSIDNVFQTRKVSYSFLGSFPAGIKKGIYTVEKYVKSLKLLFQPKTKAYESLGGFITIGKIFPGVWDWEAFWNLTAFLSIILAVMNILPIPALDGGHVTFLLYEMVTGRKPGDKFLEYAQIVGMVLLLGLLLYANGNDIIKIFVK
ncbi:MAG: RIP metalloprotease RseP [Bacteroidota bacterium]|nr:RIP metalloprotease RseP [Bacteroidota bacterium]